MKARPLAALLLLVAVPLTAGALLAPPVFAHVVPALQRAFPGFGSLARTDFLRAMDRCVMLAALAMLVPAFRMSGLMPRIREALKLSRRRAWLLAASVAVGLVSMGGAYVAGWLLGGYRASHELDSGGQMLAKAAQFLGGSVFIGLFEECFFRGFVFGALRTRLGFGTAALAASVFFASLHFLHPPLPPDFDGTKWNAGFVAMAQAAGGFELERDGAFALTLLLMGLTLCRLYERDGHLWRAIGLHGGWVWAMQSGGFALDRNWAILRGVLGPSDYVAQGPVAIPIIAAFLAWALLAGRGTGTQNQALPGGASGFINHP